MKISPENLVAAMVSACQEYIDEVKEKELEGLKKIGEEAVNEIKEIAPAYTGNDKKVKKGAYRRSWKYRIDKERGTIKVTVHAGGQQYRLTHLLENGHVLRDGTGREIGKVEPIQHISIVEANAKKKFDKLQEKI
ncbi:MAG: HK97 gp10 family phage protein [Ruminococcus sp.]|nr:HK97 gp10 family phage protein [Ruminococcus sp.]